MDRSGSHQRRAGLALAVLLLLGSPSLQAFDLFGRAPAARAVAEPGFFARAWGALLHLWNKEGPGLDPNGWPATADEGSGLDPNGVP